MDGDRIPVISFRVSEETYGALKKYADGQGQSVNEAARSAMEKFLAGTPGQIPQPSPSPAPSPGPAPQPVIPAEILALPGKLQAIKQYEAEMQKYVESMACRVGELQQEVKRLLMVVFPFMPLPPWAVMSALENPVIQELEKLAEKSDASDGA
jgi:hypothetical protein